jgi:hypothetical protein
MKNYSIQPLDPKHLINIVSFCDVNIGRGYYSLRDVEEIYQKSCKEGLCASYMALSSDQEILGVRLTYAPGTWIESDTHGLSTDDWKIDKSDMAFFKSIFLSQESRGLNLGGQLSKYSLDTLIKMKAKGVMCHSWLESPHNSSQKYLKKLGFIGIKKYPKFWEPIDYDCTRCAPKRCQCTAEEMVYYF